MKSGARFSLRSVETCPSTARRVDTGDLVEKGASTGGTSAMRIRHSPFWPGPVIVLRKPDGISFSRNSLKSKLRSAANEHATENRTGRTLRNIRHSVTKAALRTRLSPGVADAGL